MYIQCPARCIVCDEEQCCHGTYRINFAGSDRTYPDPTLAFKACLVEMLDKLLEKRVPNDNSSQVVCISTKGPVLDQGMPIIYGATLVRQNDTAFILTESLTNELNMYIASNGFGSECWASILANPGSVWIQPIQSQKNEETDDDSDTGFGKQS